MDGICLESSYFANQTQETQENEVNNELSKSDMSVEDAKIEEAKETDTNASKHEDEKKEEQNAKGIGETEATKEENNFTETTIATSKTGTDVMKDAGKSEAEMEISDDEGSKTRDPTRTKTWKKTCSGLQQH